MYGFILPCGAYGNLPATIHLSNRDMHICTLPIITDMYTR